MKQTKTSQNPKKFNDTAYFVQATQDAIILQDGVYKQAIEQPSVWCEAGQHLSEGISGALVFGLHLQERGKNNELLQLLQGIERTVQIDDLPCDLSAELMDALGSAATNVQGKLRMQERTLECYEAAFNYHERAVVLWGEVTKGQPERALSSVQEVRDVSNFDIRRDSKSESQVRRRGAALTRCNMRLRAKRILQQAGTGLHAKSDASSDYVKLNLGKAQCRLSSVASLCANQANFEKKPRATIENNLELAKDMLTQAEQNLKSEFHRGEEVNIGAAF
jgi:hypothetical protein